MRILVVSSYPPTHCGIAAYAQQQVAALRAQGHDVTVASLDGEGDTDRHYQLGQLGEIVRLTRDVAGFDRVILHYQNAFFFGSIRKSELWLKNILLAALFRRGVEVLCHELEYGRLEGALGRINRELESAKWRAAAKVVVHTSVEAERLRALVPGVRVELREHRVDFVKRTALDQGDARDLLGIPRAAKVFLCIGFLQPHKGFDRAIDAFASVESPRARLYVVGSVRVKDTPVLDHVRALERLAALDPRVSLVERFVSDEAFDNWITAADVVVVPYREIWSSSVVARAQILDRPVLATDVGGLQAQLGPKDRIVRDDRELGECLQAMAAGRSWRRPHVPSVSGLRLLAVLPWYGADAGGGAESVFKGALERLAARGASIEVLTSMVHGYHSDWSVNARPESEVVGGIPVRRFPVLPRDAAAFGPANEKICRGEPPTAEELRTFETQMIRCPGLAQAVADRCGQVDLVLAATYMFQTTLEVAAACPGQLVLFPCLHDEPYARLPPYRRLFQEARGFLFATEAERALAQRLFGVPASRCAVVGDGVDTEWLAAPEALARRKIMDWRFDLDRFFLYVGRKEGGKNFPLLIESFRSYRRKRPDAKLVLIGPGTFVPEASDEQSILDLGFVPEPEKREALAAAVALLQPSKLESFSLTCMESWLARRPVLVHGGCAVTRAHVEASGGGLWFETQGQFEAACDRLLDDPAGADRMGVAGRRYVVSRYGWTQVVDGYAGALSRFKEDRDRERVEAAPSLAV